jgi:hypothetical protein
MDIRIKVAWFLNGTTYLAAVSMILLKCWPLDRQWQIEPDPGSALRPPPLYRRKTHDCINAKMCIYRSLLPRRLEAQCLFHHRTQHIDRYIPHGHSAARTSTLSPKFTSNLTTQQIIYKAHLPTAKKLPLMLLFSGGWLVIIFGLLRCITLVTVCFPPSLLL